MQWTRETAAMHAVIFNDQMNPQKPKILVGSIARLLFTIN